MRIFHTNGLNLLANGFQTKREVSVGNTRHRGRVGDAGSLQKDEPLLANLIAEPSRHSLPLSFFANGSHPLLFFRTFLCCLPLRGRLRIHLAPFPVGLATCLQQAGARVWPPAPVDIARFASWEPPPEAIRGYPRLSAIVLSGSEARPRMSRWECACFAVSWIPFDIRCFFRVTLPSHRSSASELMASRAFSLASSISSCWARQLLSCDRRSAIP